MLPAAIIAFVSIISFPNLVGAQGPTLGVPGNPGIMRDHGAGLRTFQDNSGHQGTITDLGHGFSLYRDTHGGTKPLTEMTPAIPLGESRTGKLQFQEREKGHALEGQRNESSLLR